MTIAMRVYGAPNGADRARMSPARAKRVKRRSIAAALVAALAFVAVGPGTASASLLLTNLERISAMDNANLAVNAQDDHRVDVDIAIMDTGVQLNNVDLNVVAGVDCLQATAPSYACTENGPSLSGPQGQDSHGHGTGAASVAAAFDNVLEVSHPMYWSDTGVAAGARIWAVDVTPEEMFTDALSNGQSFQYDLDPVIAGVKWITAHAGQIDVVNMSLGCTTDPEPELAQPICTTTGHDSVAEAIDALRDAIDESVDAGVVYAAAAGNWYEELDPSAFAADLADALDPQFQGTPFANGPHFVPAILDDVITVSATVDTDGQPGGTGQATQTCVSFEVGGSPHQDEDDTNADSSHYGPGVDVAAPGVCTSLASPHVAGAAALLASMDPPQTRADVDDIRQALFGDSDCAQPSEVGAGSCDWTDESGDGVKEPMVDVGDEQVFDPATVGGIHPLAIDGDVGGDGRADLVALRGDGTVRVHPGSSGNVFGSGVSSFGGSPLDPAQYDGEGVFVVDVADVDSDRRSDLVVLEDGGDVTVYRGEAANTFDDAGVTSSLGLDPGLLAEGGHEPIAVADVNGDAYGDLVSYDDTTDRVMVYLGQGDGAFESGVVGLSNIASALHTGAGDHFVDVGDVTGDGRGDLVTVATIGDLRVYPGQNGGSFGSPIATSASVDVAMDDGTGLEPIGLGDVTGDGLHDLVFVNGSGAVLTYPALTAASTGEFGTAASTAVVNSATFDQNGSGEYIGLMHVGDDNRADLVGLNNDQDQVATVTGETNGTFSNGVFSSGTFLTTQHSQNQTSAGSEFASEKPSWRRRGCTPNGCQP